MAAWLTLHVGGDVQWDNGDVGDAKVLCPVNLEFGVDNATVFPWKHGAASDGVLSEGVVSLYGRNSS